METKESQPGQAFLRFIRSIAVNRAYIELSIAIHLGPIQPNSRTANRLRHALRYGPSIRRRFNFDDRHLFPALPHRRQMALRCCDVPESLKPFASKSACGVATYY